MSLGDTKDHDIFEAIKGLIDQSDEKTGKLINLLRQEIKQPHILGDINWRKLIEQSKEIDFLVQGVAFMPTYTPPLRDMQFVLHEVLRVTDTFKDIQRRSAPVELLSFEA